MKIGELITELQKFPNESEVRFGREQWDEGATDVFDVKEVTVFQDKNAQDKDTWYFERQIEPELDVEMKVILINGI